MTVVKEGLVVTREVNGWTILEADTNSVDYRTCEAFKAVISDLVSKGQSKLSFNLEKVSFMDSAGLGVVLHGKRQCEGAGGSFSLSNVQGYVQNLLKLTNLDRALKVYRTEEEATAS